MHEQQLHKGCYSNIILMQKKNCSVSVILSKMPHFIETVLLYCFEKFDVNRFQIDISVYKQSYTMLDL